MISPNHMKQTFGIIGYGRFGKLWARCLAPFVEVLVFDKNLDIQASHFPHGVKSAMLEEVAAAEILFLAVPISEMDVTCQEIAPLLRPTTLVVDVCSVKVYPARIMQAVLPKTQPIIATHPLFGPDSVGRLGLKNQKIAVCPVRATPDDLTKLTAILKKLDLEIIVTTPDDHDRQLARSQALVHLLGRALSDLKLSAQPIATPDYEALLRINEFVNNDTWQLFFDMQCYNPYTPLMRLTMLQSMAALEEKIRVASEAKAPDEGTFFLWRSMIDQLDHELIELVAHRLTVGRRVQEYKKLRHLPVTDPERERELKASHAQWIRDAGIDEHGQVMQKFFFAILQAVKASFP